MIGTASAPTVRRAGIAAANPVAKVAVSLAVSVVLLLTVDAVTAGTALALEVCALPWCGLRPLEIARRSWVIVVAAVPAGLATALFGVDSGPPLGALAALGVTRGSALAGLAIGLRVLAVGLPGVVLVATTDPTDLADALAQVVRLPHRFVLSALAALRLFGVLTEEWHSLLAARRARGLGPADGPAGRLRGLGGPLFALLVLAVRRATVLATVMEARGFGVTSRRTWARPSSFTPRDAAVVLGGILLAAAATAAGVAAGTWHLVLS